MIYPIDFRPEAEEDLREGHDWYQARAPKLGEDFLDCVDQALDRISRYPSSCPVVYRDVRRQLLDRFPHSILYVVEPDRVVVLAVYHGRRDPAGWKDRR
ncbi:MAG: type II toxin-antitoxin system RelE/ParE family toxin [Persicimonas sp.]